VAVDEDAGRVVVDQRALAVLSFGMAGVSEALGEDVVGERYVARSSRAPFLYRIAGEAGARGGQVLVHSPGDRTMVDDHIAGGDGGDAVSFPVAPFRLSGYARADANVADDDVVRANVESAADDGDAG